MELLLRNPYKTFKLKQQETNRDFLTIAEVQTIDAKKIVAGPLQAAKDIFVFA